MSATARTARGHGLPLVIPHLDAIRADLAALWPRREVWRRHVAGLGVSYSQFCRIVARLIGYAAATVTDAIRDLRTTTRPTHSTLGTHDQTRDPSPPAPVRVDPYQPPAPVPEERDSVPPSPAPASPDRPAWRSLLDKRIADRQATEATNRTAPEETKEPAPPAIPSALGTHGRREEPPDTPHGRALAADPRNRIYDEQGSRVPIGSPDWFQLNPHLAPAEDFAVRRVSFNPIPDADRLLRPATRAVEHDWIPYPRDILK